MARLTSEEIDELDMEFYFEREGLTFKLGQGVNGLQANLKECPACGDFRYRTYFGLDTGKGNCFVCSASFTRTSFIHAHLGHGDNEWRLTFEAVEEVLREQGWRPKRQAMVAVDTSAVTLPLSEPVSEATPAAQLYLAQRGVPLDVASYFQLRHCQFGWWKFKEDGETKMQTFSDRIIVPVFDLDGTLKTFQGRDMIGNSPKKYLFPKALPGTGRYLLNGHNCVASGAAVMGEGFFDVIAIKMALDEEQDLRDVTALGSFGKHLSYGAMDGDDQLGRLNTLRIGGLRTVTMMWDGEPKALEAALDASRLMVSIGLKARVALLPFEKDPNEVTPEVVVAAYRAARPYTPALDMMWRLQNPYANAINRARNGISD
ncbi:DNA primase [Paracoccus litorisediminis]|uniref:DNA primase n=2 Tax=Paracoccus litorisediminis TaxID=2006130 RepID=A0A844HU29_9RHOB|nr:DNA primase [Paracoccus litorisediminis]